MNTIKIKYACIDGMHFFVSGDSISKGVLVGHENLETAFNEVSVQLEYILEKNHGVKSRCVPADSLETFTAWLGDYGQRLAGIESKLEFFATREDIQKVKTCVLAGVLGGMGISAVVAMGFTRFVFSN